MAAFNGGGVGGVGPQKFDASMEELKSAISDVKTDTGEVKQDMSQLVEKVQEQVNELRTIVENSPSGVTPPCLSTISSSSNDNGIAISYKAYTGTNAQGAEPSVMSNWPIVVTKGVMVRYSSEKYPENINDGNLAFIDEDLFEVGEDGTKTGKSKSQTVAGLTSGNTYYFTAFTYSNYGVYNESMSRSNCTKCQWTGTKSTLTVNVTRDFNYKTLGSYTATMTPTAGGQATQKTQSGETAIVFSGLEAGEYTLSFSSPQYFSAPQSQRVTLVAGQPDTKDCVFNLNITVNDCTWKEIQTIAKNGDAPDIFSVGEEKNIQCNFLTNVTGTPTTGTSKYSVPLALISFGQDSANSIQFFTKKIVGTGTDYGSSESLLTDVNTEFLKVLPSDLTACIKTVSKKRCVRTSQSQEEMRSYSTKLYLLTETEIGFSPYYDETGTKYPYFTSNDRRALKRADNSGSYSWFTCSPGNGYTTSWSGPSGSGSSWGTRPFAYVSTDGSKTSRTDNSSLTEGIAFAFSIG